MNQTLKARDDSRSPDCIDVEIITLHAALSALEPRVDLFPRGFTPGFYMPRLWRMRQPRR